MQITMQMSSSESRLLGLLGSAKAKHKLGFPKWTTPVTVTLGQPRLGPLEDPNSDPESCNCDQGVLRSTAQPDRSINRVARVPLQTAHPRKCLGSCLFPSGLRRALLTSYQ